MTFVHSTLQSTDAFNRDASKNAPLNFLRTRKFVSKQRLTQGSGKRTY